MAYSYHGPGMHVCSFHDADGQGEVNGRMYYWSFSERFGPLFTTANGRELRKQPGPKTYAWLAFERWHAARRAKQLMNAVSENDGNNA